MIDKQQALEIIDKRDFFNDRAGRELWNDKPKEIQDEDIRNAHEDYEALKEYILNQPKVGEWIPVEERLPGQSLNSVIGWDTYRERCVFVQYYMNEWVLGNHESVNIVAWQPLPEPYKGETE